MAAIEVKVPDIGDFKNVPVIEILVKPGDTVKKDESLITLESDKATMEVPAPFGGTVRELRVKVGDKVSEGSAIATVERAEGEGPKPAPVEPKPSDDASPPAPPPPPKPAAPSGSTQPARTEVPPPTPAPSGSPQRGHAEGPAYPGPSSEAGHAPPHASPAIRRFARELGVDLERVEGSGPKGRILKEDVQEHVKRALGGAAPSVAKGGGLADLGLPAWPQVDFAKFGPVERQARSRIQKISGPALARNWVMIPHVTQYDEADVTELEAFRKQVNDEHAKDKQAVKVTLLAFLIKAAVAALKQFPALNSSLDGDELVIKKYWHIGFAADTPQGLVVPVVRDADQKGVLEIARETAELAAKARDGKLAPTDMQGGTFSISSLGGIGGTSFTPIINAPEVAILGVSKTAMKPVWNGSAFEPRLMLPLSLSYDHRVVDGALGARFTAYLAHVVTDLRRVLL